MKTLKLIALAAFALLFSQCKSPTQVTQGQNTPSLIEVARILDTTGKMFLQFAGSTNGNPWKAIMLTTGWVNTQPNVQAAEAQDSVYINILLKSGLQTQFSFIQVDANGKSLFDGGGGGSSAPALTSERMLFHDPKSSNLVLSAPKNILADNDIKNKNVLFYCPAYSQQLSGYDFQKVTDYFTNSKLGFTVTVLKDSQCSYKTVETFKDYGLVLLRTHGGPDNFLTGSSFSVYPDVTISDSVLYTIIVSQLGQDCLDKLFAGKLRTAQSIAVNIQVPGWNNQVIIGRSVQILCTTDYIESIHSMSGTVLFGIMCYSGQSSSAFNGKIPMKTAWMGKSPISYYGWAHADGTSAPVHTSFDNQMMDTLCRVLAVNLDSTGHAHLDGQGNEFADYFEAAPLYLKHFGADDYSYPPPCIDSFVDARDGQMYRAVCIGKQTWMAQNLNYDESGSVCYDNISTNCNTYGRLYNWNTVMHGASSTDANPSGVQGVCPHGWHVPSNSEFQQLLSFLGAGAAGALKSTTADWTAPNVGATNSSGFSALPSGYTFAVSSPAGNSLGLGTTDDFVTTTINSNWNIWSMNNYSADPSFVAGVAGGWGYSCRCVKDK